MRLDAKAAIVTGAGSGNGRAIALRFAEEGADLGLIDVNLAGLAETARLARARDRKAFELVADVTQREQVEDAIARGLAALGALDVFVSNAGIGIRRPFLEMTDEDWDRVIAVNLRGVFICGQVAARVMVGLGRNGRIVNLGSVYAETVTAEMAAYCASKAGVQTLTKSMALELAPYGIRVNAIAPAIIETPMTQHRLDDPELRATYLANLPLGRIGRPEDVANAALFLASDESDFMTGATLLLDGGWTLR